MTFGSLYVVSALYVPIGHASKLGVFHSTSSVSKLRLLNDSCLLRWPPLANDAILGMLACLSWPLWRELPCLNGGGENFPLKVAAWSAVTGSMLLNGLGLGTLNTGLS